MDKDIIYTHTHIYTYNVILLAIMPLAATGMGLEMIILSEVGQTKTNIM